MIVLCCASIRRQQLYDICLLIENKREFSSFPRKQYRQLTAAYLNQLHYTSATFFSLIPIACAIDAYESPERATK